MKGHYKKRGCACNPKQCTCGKKWTFVIPAGKDIKTGKRKQATKGGFETEHDAQVAAAALYTEINQGTYIKESNILFSDFSDEWLHVYIERNAPQPGTIRLRKYSINMILNYFDHMRLKDITTEMYQAVLNDLKDRGYSKSTIEGVHTTGRMIFELAMNKRMLKLNVTESAYIKRDPRIIVEFDEDELPIYFEKEELALFLGTAKEKGLFLDTLIFHTLAYTGIRVGELVALKWKDINFEKQMISITKAYKNPTNNTKEYKLGPPKTKKSRRRLVVDELVIDAFRKHKEEQEKLIKRFGDRYYNEDFVFANFNNHPGYPISIKLVNTRIARLLKKTELNLNVASHSFRHTHTSLLAEAGVGLEEIMDRLGHQDDEVTRRVYLHVTNEMKTEASNKFSELMRSIS